MSGIPRFSPTDLGGQQFTHNPGDVANAIQQSFFAAQENSRQNRESQRADERMTMAQVDQGVRLEETEYQRTLRPMREQEMRLGLEMQGLQIAQQGVNLQSAQGRLDMQKMEIAQQGQYNRLLTEGQEWMASYDGGGSQGGGVPVTYFSYGKDVGGPDEEQDRYTNQGMSRTGKNLTTGVVAVNTNRYPIGTVFRDNNTQEVYIAADSHGNADPNVVDVFAEPGQYRAAKERRDFQVIATIPEKDVPRTAQGIQELRNRYRQSGGPGPGARTDGTGIPTLGSVTSVTTPTGTPVVSAAANSTNPMGVINQSFSPEQREALARYDMYGNIAATAPQQMQRTHATYLRGLMDNNPQFQQVKSQRDELIRSAQAQVQVQGILQSASPDLIAGFQSRYAGKYRIGSPNGNAIPLNGEGQPLDSQGYASFSRAFLDYAQNYKFDPMGATTEMREFNAIRPKLLQLQAYNTLAAPKLDEFLTVGDTTLTPADKGYEVQLKAYNDAQKRYQEASQTRRLLEAEVAMVGMRNPQVAQFLSRAYPAPQATGTQGPPANRETTTPARPTLSQLSARPEDTRAQERDNEVWTDLKSRLSKNLVLEGVTDSGSASMDNPALSLAAKIYSGSTDALDEGNQALGGKLAQPLGKVSTGIGSRSLYPADITRAWAEDILIKYKYLDPKTKREPRASSTPARGNIEYIIPK